MGNAHSTKTTTSTTPLSSMSTFVPLDVATAYGHRTTIHKSASDLPKPRAKPVITHKCRLLSHDSPIELTSTEVQTAHGQKYVYFTLPKATTLHNYSSVVCTSAGGEEPVANAFALSQLKCAGMKCNADGAYIEYTCNMSETGVQAGDNIHNIHTAKAAMLMARIKVKDRETAGDSRLGTPQTGWVVVWTYRVG